MRLMFRVCFSFMWICVVESRDFRIAWMAPKKEYHSVNAASSVGGLKLALKNLQHILSVNHTVRVKWYDSDCNLKSSLAAAVDAREKFNPDLFLGPPCSSGMRGVAQLASHWNLPVFGWVSNDIEFRDKKTYSTLVRMLGPLNRFSTTMTYVCSMFRWRRFAMIHDSQSPYRAASDAITSATGPGNYTITSTHRVYESMDDEEIKQIFQQVRKYARIIIFAVPWHTLRKYLLVAYDLQMTDGEFAFLCIHGDLYTWEVLERDVLSDRGWRRNDPRDNHARQAFESVIHVTMDTLGKETYQDFQDFVSNVNALENPHWELPNGTEPDAYAPFLYDATLFWALLAISSLNEGTDPKDGSLLFRKANNKDLEVIGVTGPIVLDEMRDRFLNFWMLDMQDDGTFKRFTEIHYDISGVILLSEVNDSVLVRWPHGKVGPENAPPDIPVCGFEGEHCMEDYTDHFVGAAVGSSTVLAIAIVINVFLRENLLRHGSLLKSISTDYDYRRSELTSENLNRTLKGKYRFRQKRYRRQQLLQSMLWKVRLEEIDFVTALMCGSVRSSFRNLARRRSSKKMFKSKNNEHDESPDNSPSQQQRILEPGAMFGSVAYVRGSLVSVKKMSKSTVSLTRDVLEELNQLMELKHQNLCAFVGSCIDFGRILLLWEYCTKGSLQDVIWNQNIKLDRMFMFALCQDVAKGLDYVHKSGVRHHGNLKSSNCVVDSRWTCKLTDFGVSRIRTMDKASFSGSDESHEKDLWAAPEVLRSERSDDFQKADIYALGIILKEVFTRSGPYTDYPFLTAYEVVTKVRDRSSGVPPFRPMLARELRQSAELCTLVEECWSEDPICRPSAARVVKALNRLNPSKNLTMIDNMIAMLEKYANHLEELVAERTSELDVEKKKTENLLYRMLPQSVAEDLRLGKPVKAESFDDATIYFSDIVGFTTICSESTPIEVVNLLNSLYILFDDIITKYDVYKVETIGDAYMIASGLPMRNGNRHIQEIANCALDILASTKTFCIPHQPHKNLRIRVGIHRGPVVAGVVGLAMPRYCLFGDTVNTASRMESTGLPMKIHMSSAARDELDKQCVYHLQCRGEIQVKGKGLMTTYFLVGKDGFDRELPNCDECPISPSDTISPTSPTPQIKLWNQNDKEKKTSILEITSL